MPQEFTAADVAEHIARQDPAATLRRIAAHRRILKRHSPQEEGMGAIPPDFIEYREISPVCERCGQPGEYGVVWPCDDVRDLAEIYGVSPS